MYQRPQNDYLRVNKRKSNYDQLNADSNSVPQLAQTQPRVQVYIIDKNDFKSLVQQLTSPQPCDRLPQNIPKHQDIRPEPINWTSSIPPSAMAVQEDPDVSLYMAYLQSLLEESSGSNGDQFEEPFDKYHSHMMAQSQPQDPTQSMPQSNGFEPFPSSWFNGSPQEMHGASSLQSTRVDYEYPLPLTPNFTFSSMTQHEVFGSDLDSIGPDEDLEFSYEIN
ncbi:unnamed protein product [Arabidopsis thaliana]|uniref:VQ domain-containing protein n=1 Tax=Arabidopsis thaliana TaxID=3702 RepID=A0A654EFJ9_ARATH|nr:unnamed protein product [Arabidopsis thaliana]